MVQRQHEKDTRPFTWKIFMEAFKNKCFPKSIRQHKEIEFIKLEIGSRTVTKYKVEFVRLAKFAPGLVATEKRRARRFKEGLRSCIKHEAIPFELTSYREVVSKSLLVERAQLLDKEENKAQPSGHRCGKPNHFTNDCKERSFSSSNNEQKKTQARVFIMSKKDSEEASTVVTEIQNFELEIVPRDNLGYFANMTIKPTLLKRIKALQYEDPRVLKFQTEVADGKCTDFIITTNGAFRYGIKHVVLDDEGLKQEIMREAHNTPYSIYPRSTKLF
ncbi:reverse transcriptase [Abeliophyllum distichum]|uniref:Reverse transcriptase n=1 Tax=Abeliophyllum distichum TaxID=126358 RepID=A0ABD1VYK2_9LAMI